MQSISASSSRRECTVCLEVLSDKLVVFSCGHILHGPCANKLILLGKNRPKCPICRKNVTSCTNLYLTEDSTQTEIIPIEPADGSDERIRATFLEYKQQKEAELSQLKQRHLQEQENHIFQAKLISTENRTLKQTILNLKEQVSTMKMHQHQNITSNQKELAFKIKKIEQLKNENSILLARSQKVDILMATLERNALVEETRVMLDELDSSDIDSKVQLLSKMNTRDVATKLTILLNELRKYQKALFDEKMATRNAKIANEDLERTLRKLKSKNKQILNLTTPPRSPTKNAQNIDMEGNSSFSPTKNMLMDTGNTFIRRKRSCNTPTISVPPKFKTFRSHGTVSDGRGGQEKKYFS